MATLPADGTYYLYLNDAQHKGNEAYAYRLRISEPRPDFALRVVPSAINVEPARRFRSPFTPCGRTVSPERSSSR